MEIAPETPLMRMMMSSSRQFTKPETTTGLRVEDVAPHLTSIHDRVDKVSAKIGDFIGLHSGFVAWSGGQDSTAVVDLVRRVSPGFPICWYDSGLEFPENRKYIENLATDWNLNLHVYKASPTALEILQETGLWNHVDEIYPQDPQLMHDVLITSPSNLAHKSFGMGEISGLRADESVGRRMLLSRADGKYHRKNGEQVYAPIWDWSDNALQAYFAYRQIPTNPVYEKLELLGASKEAQRVGLVVDGNNPDYGRYTYLRLGWPVLWQELKNALPRLNEWK